MDCSSPDAPKLSSLLNPNIIGIKSPVTIRLAGNEEFLDKVAALFVRQLQSACETEREQETEEAQRGGLNKRPDRADGPVGDHSADLPGPA